MKLKVYKGDLSKLHSCIKVRGTEIGIIKVIKKLTKASVPFKADDDLNLYIQFKDYLKSGISSIGFKEVQVVEHIEPLELDIKLGRTEYSSHASHFMVCEYYGVRGVTIAGFKGDDVYWLAGVCGEVGKDNCKNFSKFSASGFEVYRHYQSIIAGVLFRRSLIDEQTFSDAQRYLKSIPLDMRYYEI